MKDKMSQRPGAPPCDTIENGLILFCIKKHLFLNCPNPKKDAECEKTKTFLNCVMSQA